MEVFTHFYKFVPTTEQYVENTEAYFSETWLTDSAVMCCEH